MPDTIAVAAIAVGGVIAGALATVGAAFLRRGPDNLTAEAAIEAAEAATRTAIASQFKALMDEATRSMDRMMKKIECLEVEVHELRTTLQRHGIDPPRSARRFAAETGTPD